MFNGLDQGFMVVQSILKVALRLLAQINYSYHLRDVGVIKVVLRD